MQGRWIAIASLAIVTALARPGAEDSAPSAFFPLETRWTVGLAAPAARPAFDAAHAYLPLRTGRLVAIALSTGVVRWTLDHAAVSPPATGSDLLFVAEAGSIQGIDPSDGRARWTRPLDARVSAPLVCDGARVVAALATGELMALHVADGQVVWRRSLGASTRITPAADAGRLYVSLEDGRVMAIDQATGEPVWTRKLPGTPLDILPLDDRLFVGSTDNFFYCLGTKEGNRKWRWRTGADPVGAAVADQRRVYFVALDNLLRALDRGSGVLRWHKPLTLRPSSGPLRAGDVLLVPGIGAELRGFRPADGAPAGEFVVSADRQLAAPPHLVRGPDGGIESIVILTRDGQLTALAPAPATGAAPARSAT